VRLNQIQQLPEPTWRESRAPGKHDLAEMQFKKAVELSPEI